MNFRVEKDVMVPMRDGTQLATDLWVPDSDGPVPVLLVRLPYSKDLFPAAEIDYPTMPNIFRLLEAGYAIAYQDCRGTGRSEGLFNPMVNEPVDGADTITWLREQPWCDGAVGSFGHSYLGMTQWASASTAVEGLMAIAPTMTTTDYYISPWYSEGGALSWHIVWTWTNLMLMLPTNDSAASPQGAEKVAEAAALMLANAEQHLTHVPFADQPLFDQWSWWNDMVGHTERDGYWTDLAVIERRQQIAVPALHIGGWFDPFVQDMTRTFTRLKAEAGTAAARDGQRLIIGPWDHMHFTGEYHDRQFGLASSVPAADLTMLHLDFFDHNIRGRAVDLPPVRIFVMGADEWRDELDWPLPDTVYTDFYLSAPSGVFSDYGDGALTTSPATADSEDTFTYDPADPVPTLGGRVLAPASLNEVGPVDQRAVEKRDDVLCYTTDPMVEAVEVTGHVSAVLHVSSSAVDTDFTVKLVDVFPDGRAIYLTDGITRARYRKSLGAPSLLEPGAVYEIEVDMSVTSNVFQPGHRIRVEVSSSNFPRYDRNPNTGESLATTTDWAVATNTVLHGPKFPSRVVLPIISR